MDLRYCLAIRLHNQALLEQVRAVCASLPSMVVMSWAVSTTATVCVWHICNSPSTCRSGSAASCNCGLLGPRTWCTTAVVHLSAAATGVAHAWRPVDIAPECRCLSWLPTIRGSSLSADLLWVPPWVGVWARSATTP